MMLCDKIAQVCITFDKKVLFACDAGSYSGLHLAHLIQLLQKKLKESAIADATVVAIKHEPGAHLAALILALMANRKIPLIFNHWWDDRKVHQICEKYGVTGLLASNNWQQGQIDIHITKIARDPLELDEAALCLFTSGSSGEPKIVVIKEHALKYVCDQMRQILHLDEETRGALVLPLFHTMGLNTQFLPTFFSGGYTHIINTELSMGSNLRYINALQVGLTSVVADLIPYLYKEFMSRSLLPNDTMQVIQVAGGAIASKHMQALGAMFPEATLYKGYGLTEAIRVAMTHSKNTHFDSSVSGFVLPPHEVMICDESLNPLPLGIEGEVCIKGPTVFLGYLQEGGRLAKHEGFLRTGDVGLIHPDGALQVNGRLDSVFKVHGRKVSGLEITAILCKDAELSTVVTLPCEDKDSGSLRPVCFLELNESSISDLGARLSQWEQWLRKDLEPYKIPRALFILNQMPRLENHKLNRKALFQLFERYGVQRPVAQAPYGMRLYSIPDEAYHDMAIFR